MLKLLLENPPAWEHLIGNITVASHHCCTSCFAYLQCVYCLNVDSDFFKLLLGISCIRCVRACWFHRVAKLKLTDADAYDLHLCERRRRNKWSAVHCQRYAAAKTAIVVFFNFHVILYWLHLLHLAWGTAEAKCILTTAVCVSIRRRIPTLLHGPGCNLGNGMGAV